MACWKGGVNTGTLHSALGIPIALKETFFDGTGSLQNTPFILDDPLSLTHPTMVRHNPEFDMKCNTLARAEWWNALPSVDGVLGSGMRVCFCVALASKRQGGTRVLGCAECIMVQTALDTTSGMCFSVLKHKYLRRNVYWKMVAEIGRAHV